MLKVKLVETEIIDDIAVMITTFIGAAYKQGFDPDWVETILLNATADNCANFMDNILKYIEIMLPAQEW